MQVARRNSRRLPLHLPAKENLASPAKDTALLDTRNLWAATDAAPPRHRAAPHSRLHPQSLRATANAPARFTILALAEKDARLSAAAAGLRWAVSMRGPGRAEAAAVDNGDGSYTVTCTAHSSGRYRLAIRLNNAHLRGSPFAVSVAEGSGQSHAPEVAVRLDGFNRWASFVAARYDKRAAVERGADFFEATAAARAFPTWARHAKRDAAAARERWRRQLKLSGGRGWLRRLRQRAYTRAADRLTVRAARVALFGLEKEATLRLWRARARAP